MCLSGAASAQEAADVRLVFRGVPASEALAAIAEAGGVNVAFSTDLVGARPVWCGGAGWTAEDLLRCVTGAVGLDYVRRSTGTYVVVARVVEPVAPGAVAGLVVDAETGEPLPLAHVRLADATAVADRSGRFALAGVAPGRQVLLASFVGYRSSALRLGIAPGAVARPTIRLRPTVASTGAVVVDGIEARGASEALGADVGFEVLPERVAGAPPETETAAPLANGAPAPTSSVGGPALQPLLGVGGRTFRDGLSLQGGEAGEHALALDGAQIYEPLAIGPALGSLSPLAVDRVTVHKAGFGARHGSRLAGLIETQHVLERPADGPLAVAAEADVYAAGARLQHHAEAGRLGGDPVEVTTLVAARRSLWDVVRPASLDRALQAWNDVDPVLAAALDADGPMARERFDLHRHGSDLAFADLHVATRVRVGPLRSLQASVYRGTADVATELVALGAPVDGALDPSAPLLARDATRWTNLAATLRGEAVVSARWRVGAGARLSRHALRQRYDAVDGRDAGLDGTEAPDVLEARLGAALDALDLADNGNALDELALEADATVALGRGREVSVGAEGVVARSRFHLLSSGFGSTAFRDLDAAHTQARLAAVADARLRLGARWTVEPGLRLTARAATGDVLAEPRLAVRYDALPTDRLGPIPLAGVAARLAGGVYRQFATRVELATFGPSALVPDVAVWLPVDATVEPPSALHLAGEVLWQPSDRWAARVEGYAKALPRVYALDYGALLAADAPPPPLAAQADFLLPEHGRSVGVGARVERQSPRWAASAGLAVARTERRSDARFDGRWVPAPWAEPVRATLGLDVLAAGRRDAGLLVRARALGIWGRTWALRRAYYDVLPALGVDAVGPFALDRPEGDRLAPLLTLDVGLATTLPLGGARRAEVALDVANVLDRHDPLDWSLRPGPDGTPEAVTRDFSGIQPSLRVRVSL
ncbi:hypothetical protein BSZ37_08055 [Rubrivirga marina]|uniref:Secretin/TonB short N-terminal domain-containing protein n=1 Tax=Rubrivirga marina TaxID=1196024 RepID=A0A271IZ45_9BACT|nr:hypothetical protein BSZ37_08055 [Rubrivirga marina]